MSTEIQDLRTFVLWMLGGGTGWVIQRFLEWLAGPTAEKLLERLKLPPFDKWAPEVKWLLAYGLDVLLAWAFYGIALAMMYLEPPVGWRAWVETLFAVGFLPVVVQQATYRARKSRAVGIWKPKPKTRKRRKS